MRRELGLPEQATTIGLFGNLIDWKRPIVFAEAAARISETWHEPVHFLVLGDDRGDFGPEMQRIADRAGIGERFHILGFRHPVWPYLCACDLVFAPAVGEPFGRSLVEAMLVGSTVVASDSGGHREILSQDETGLLVTPDDAEALAEAAVALLRDAARCERITRAAMHEAVDRFGADEHARRVVGVYDELLVGA